jgi:flagellar basal body-associated protein FliL
MKMKQKDIIYLLLAVVILIATAFLFFTLLAPKSGASQKSANATVEIVDPIATEFDSAGQKALTDPAVTKDFTQPVDLTTGLGNPQLFGPY